MDSCGSTMNHDTSDSPESILVGGPIQENKDLCALADPITYIDKDDPPFLIIHGNADPLVPHCQSEMLHKVLKTHRVQSELIIVPGEGHGEGVWTPENVRRMVEFFKEVLE